MLNALTLPLKNDAKRVDTSVKNDVKEDAAKVEGKKAVKAKENLLAGVYPDTKDNWARDAIQAMTQAGYLSGYADNTFKPGAQLLVNKQLLFTAKYYNIT